TLFNVLAREIIPLSGVVESLPVRLMTQRTELFRDNLRNNLGFANPSANDTDIINALYSAGLTDFLQAQSEGLDTVLGEGGLGLSGGQARRFALARLFLTDAPIWLLDEPTEGLDVATANDVISRLGEQAQNHTLLIATHIQREARLCNRLIILEQGRIIESVVKNDCRYDE